MGRLASLRTVGTPTRAVQSQGKLPNRSPGEMPAFSYEYVFSGAVEPVGVICYVFRVKGEPYRMRAP